jgi:probable phosphoglycerate mutase
MKKETNIYLTRHGETEWNIEHRIQGNQNSPLTPKGIRQAHEVKESMESCSIDFAYVSPLQRARDTIDIILEDREIAPVALDNLREISLGPWEGKTREETAITHPEQHSAFWGEPALFNL